MRFDKWVVLACAVGLLGGLILSGCPSTGITCPKFLAACGQGCADYSNDKANCGACGIACQAGQICSAGTCVCQPGSQSCGGACVATSSDPQNCGGCAGDGGTGAGKVCSAGQVCDNGQCQQSCGLTNSNRCGNACVDFTTDPRNCGGCGVACPDKQTCHAGACSYDVVVACFGSHGVTGLEDVPGTPLRWGPVQAFGSGPASLGVDQGVLLSADGLDQLLYEGNLSALVPFHEAPQVGKAANHVVVEDPYVYVVNSVSHNLEVLQRGASPDAGIVLSPDAGALAGGADGGLGLVPVAVFDFGANTYPQALAKLGGQGYVALQGTNKLALVNLADPRNPLDGGAWVDLQPFATPGGSASPSGVLARNGSVYITLSNLDSNYNAVANGKLVRYSPGDGGLSLLDLGPDCLNAYWLTATPDQSLMYVSCGGAGTYDPTTYAVLSVAHAGVQLFGADDTRLSSWSPGCVNGSDAGCATFSPGRLAVRGGSVYVADNSYGRVVVLDTVNRQLVERVGFQDGGTPPVVCPSNGASLVSDVLVLP